MKKILFVISLVVAMLTSCANLSVGFEEDSPFYAGGVIYIYLPDTKDTQKYRVYINNEDTLVQLTPRAKTRFGIIEGQTNIQVVKGRETASIDIFLNKSNEYYLKVIRNEKNKIALIQVPKSSIASSVKNTALYLNEKAQEAEDASQKAEATAIITDYGEESSMEQDPKVNKYTKAPANGDTIFYYDPEEGE